MKKITEKKKNLLREFVSHKCEQCGKKEKLVPHRINRGHTGGEYILRNIKMLCPKCHKLYHSGEFK